MKSKILVIGYPGWLSESLCEVLIGNGYKVLAVGINDSVVNLINSQNFEYKKFDILSVRGLENIASDCEYVINCAGIIHPNSISDYYLINAIGVLNIVNFINSGDIVKKFIHISSNAVSGRSIKNIIRDENSIDIPLNHYGNSKLIGERIIEKYCKKPYIILRPCMFYSNNAPARHKNIERIISKGFFPIFGGGSQLRSVTSLSDLTHSILSAIETQISNDKFYICDDTVLTLAQIINSIGVKVGVEVALLNLPNFIPVLAYKIDNFMQNRGFYFQKLHLLGEANWSVGYSNRKIKSKIGFNPKGNYIKDNK